MTLYRYTCPKFDSHDGFLIVVDEPTEHATIAQIHPLCSECQRLMDRRAVV